MSWPDEIMEDWDPRDRFRFVLVKIAFKQALADQGNPELRKLDSQVAPTTLAKAVVELVDAQLTAMEKTPDTGPSMLLALRAKLQEALTQDADANARTPTADERILGYRDGTADTIRAHLRLMDEAIEKTGEAVSPAHETRPTRSEEDGGLLV